MSTISVNVAEAYEQGRNGSVDLSRIEVWTSLDGHVAIDGVSKTRKITVNGGFARIKPSEMTTLCHLWLETHGYRVLALNSNLRYCPTCGRLLDWRLKPDDDNGADVFGCRYCNLTVTIAPGYPIPEGEDALHAWEAQGFADTNTSPVP